MHTLFFMEQFLELIVAFFMRTMAPRNLLRHLLIGSGQYILELTRSWIKKYIFSKSLIKFKLGGVVLLKYTNKNHLNIIYIIIIIYKYFNTCLGTLSFFFIDGIPWNFCCGFRCMHLTLSLHKFNVSIITMKYKKRLYLIDIKIYN